MAVDLNAVREALAKATPGDWEAETFDDCIVSRKHTAGNIIGFTGAPKDKYPESYKMWLANAHLIANAPTWLRAMADELEALRAEKTAQDAVVARTMTDHGRMLWQDDVSGICPTPESCFDHGGSVRCSPCANKQAIAKGIAPDLSPPYSPEVCRLNRELASLREVLRRIARTGEMSAGIMRDTRRTGNWDGAENTARAFENIGMKARAALANGASQ